MMLRIILLIIAFTLLPVTSHSEALKPLPKPQPAPDMALPDITGKLHDLK